MAVEIPSGDWANPFVLEGCHGNGSDSSLGLERLGPFEIQEDTLFSRFDICPGRVPGLCCGWGGGGVEVGDPEVRQETKDQSHPWGPETDLYRRLPTVLMRSSFVTAGLCSGWGPAV